MLKMGYRTTGDLKAFFIFFLYPAVKCFWYFIKILYHKRKKCNMRNIKLVSPTSAAEVLKD